MQIDDHVLPCPKCNPWPREKTAPLQPDGDGLEVVAWVVTGISSERALSQLGWTIRAFLVSQPDAEQQHANWLLHYQSVTTDELCRLSDAQRAIAELREEISDLHQKLDKFYNQSHGIPALAEIERLREECERLRNCLLEVTVRHFSDSLKRRSSDKELEQYLSDGIAQLEAERDTLRQQLDERDAEIDHLLERTVLDAESIDRAEAQRDRLAGLLREVRLHGVRASLMQRIDAALAEVKGREA